LLDDEVDVDLREAEYLQRSRDIKNKTLRDNKAKRIATKVDPRTLDLLKLRGKKIYVATEVGRSNMPFKACKCTYRYVRVCACVCVLARLCALVHHEEC